MPMVESFVGGGYAAIAPIAGADLAVNLYPETRGQGSAKTRWLVGTPGLRAFGAAGSETGCRGEFTHDGLTLAVTGIAIDVLDLATQTRTQIGTLPDNGEPVSWASNGQGGDQIAVCGGNVIKVINRLTLAVSAAVTLPFTGPVQLAFMDGYTLALQRDSPVIWFSALENATSWDALDFFARSGTSDDLVGLAATQDRLWAWGTKTTTLFYDSGDADTPFLPYPGTATAIGAVSPWAIARHGDAFTWLSQREDGGLSVVTATGGPTPTRVATAPVEAWLRGCTTTADAEMLAYEMDGHAFVALTCPSSPDDIQTYVWDAAEGVWHTRASWDATAGLFRRWRARGVVQVAGVILVGDATTGDLYYLDPATYDENGDILMALRRMPYLSDDPAIWLFLSQIELVCQVGVGLVTGQGSAPVASLRISRDGAQTWLAAGTASLGALGARLTRVLWRNLGRVRADRLVIEVRQSDPVARVWLGLSLRSQAGAGRA